MKRLFSLLGGVAIGAVLGLLLAPQSGEETREQIKKLLQEKMPNLSKEHLEALVDEVIAKVKESAADAESTRNDDDEA